MTRFDVDDRTRVETEEHCRRGENIEKKNSLLGLKPSSPSIFTFNVKNIKTASTFSPFEVHIDIIYILGYHTVSPNPLLHPYLSLYKQKPRNVVRFSKQYLYLVAEGETEFVSKAPISEDEINFQTKPLRFLWLFCTSGSPSAYVDKTTFSGFFNVILRIPSNINNDIKVYLHIRRNFFLFRKKPRFSLPSSFFRSLLLPFSRFYFILFGKTISIDLT